MLQNYPNPFNGSTTIRFSVPFRAHVDIDVIDMTGQRVTGIVSKVLEKGNYLAEWNAEGFASGVYFGRLRSGAVTLITRMLLLR